MDREKANKFLGLDDRIKLDRISATHEGAERSPHGVVQDAMTFDGSNAKSRHKDRGELLGVIDRLLTTTAHFYGEMLALGRSRDAYKAEYEKAAAELNAANVKLGKAEERIGQLVNDYNILAREHDSLIAHRNDALNKLAQHQSFGDIMPWFGGPQAGLTLKDAAAGRVFAKHDGVLYSFGQISALATHYKTVCENYRKENADLRKLADKPMQILDDAQGYYTVNAPGLGSSVTVKTLVANFRVQAETIGSYQKDVERLNETTQRKNEKILELTKEIKGLKHAAEYAGLTPLRAQVQLPNGEVLELGDLVDRYLTQQRVIRASHNHLRQTQEDLGDVMVAHDEACKTIDVLNSRLDKIEEMAYHITDITDGSTEPEFEENLGVDPAYFVGPEEFHVVDIEIGPGVWGRMMKYGKKD